MGQLEKLTIKCMFEESIKLYGDRPSLAHVGQKPMTYNELGQKVKEVQILLQDRGIQKGDKVVILSENRVNWGVAYLAIVTMGAVAVPILPDFHQNEIQHIIRHSESKGIFVSEKLFPKIEDVKFPSVNFMILINNFEPIKSGTKKSGLKELLARGENELNKMKEAARKLSRKTTQDVEEDDLAAIVYTSGTTGNSKGVMLTHKNLTFDAIAAMSAKKVETTDRFLSILPLSHTYECTVGFLIPVMNGASIYYFEKPPTPRLLLDAMQKVKPTVMLSVPLVIEKIYKTRILPELQKNAVLRGLQRVPFLRNKIYEAAGKKLIKSFGGKIEFFGIGGALLAADVEAFLRKAKFPYAIGYGLTETSPISAGTGPEKTRYRSTGPALPGVQIKIHNPNPKTGEGEVWIKGPNVMKGYYRDPERTAEVITEDGWFKSGDLGVLDEDGYLYIKGRVKNMIVGPSGENIYPEEIEAYFNEFEYVLETLVYMDKGKLTARVHLNYEELDKHFADENLTETQIRERIKALLEDLRIQVNERVSSYSRIHRIIEQREPFEKTPTHKTKRYLYVTDNN
ncbi:MAG: long-chain fatty acid--CoA ligase [Calditrichia bacterium]